MNRFFFVFLFIHAWAFSDEESSKVKNIFDKTCELYSECMCEFKYSPAALSDKEDPKLINLSGKMEAYLNIIQYILTLPEDK